MLISKTIIIGSNSFLGKNIISKIGRAKALKFSSTIKKDYVHYKIGDNIGNKINKKFKITKIIYLAWERRNIKKGRENINIYGIKKINNFAKKNNIPLYFASSFSAIIKKNNYGKLKFQCEKLILKNKLNRVFRIAMITSKNGGLIHKIQKFFNKLPFFIMPGDGEFKIYIVKIDKVVNLLLKNYKNLKKINYVYNKPSVKFNELFDTKNKILINFPIWLIKFLLIITNFFNFSNSSFNYDGFLGLINNPKIVKK
jgi:nucleoside-diphosphate-sugar epimerase